MRLTISERGLGNGTCFSLQLLLVELNLITLCDKNCLTSSYHETTQHKNECKANRNMKK